jgi:hypothetical protein
MNYWLTDIATSYLHRPVRSLHEACQRVGRDDGGLRCVDCPLRERCRDETRWLVRQGGTEPLPFY